MNQIKYIGIIFAVSAICAIAGPSSTQRGDDEFKKSNGGPKTSSDADIPTPPKPELIEHSETVLPTTNRGVLKIASGSNASNPAPKKIAPKRLRYVDYYDFKTKQKKKSEGEMDNGIKWGLWTFYYESENANYKNVKEKGRYKDGKRFGKWELWSKEGELTTEDYINGVLKPSQNAKKKER